MEDVSQKAFDSFQNVEQSAKRGLTLLYHELPLWAQENNYITRGYRPPSNSYRGSILSLGYLHNETVNIYSHLLGCLSSLVSSVIVYFSLFSRYSTATREDVIVFCCFFGGAATCLGMSAAFHTILNHSHAVAAFGNKLDYLGIVALIWGSFVPTLYYGFQARPELIQWYWAMACISAYLCPYSCPFSTHSLPFPYISHPNPASPLLSTYLPNCPSPPTSPSLNSSQITTLSAGTAVVATAPKFRTPALRPFRAVMFVALGLSAVLPVLHGVKIFGVAKMREMIGLDYVVAQGAFYILGAMIYAVRLLSLLPLSQYPVSMLEGRRGVKGRYRG
jgi:adiponectin receptor